MFRSLVAPTFESDVLQNTGLLKLAVRYVLKRDKGINGISDFDIRFHKVGDYRYRAETSLNRQLTLSTDALHQVIKTSLLGIAGVKHSPLVIVMRLPVADNAGKNVVGLAPN